MLNRVCYGKGNATSNSRATPLKIQTVANSALRSEPSVVEFHIHTHPLPRDSFIFQACYAVSVSP